MCHLTHFSLRKLFFHDNVIKLKHFPRHWPFLQGIHRSPVNSSHKGQWRGALMLSLICVWINSWVKKREAGDLRCHRAHYDIVMCGCCTKAVCYTCSVKNEEKIFTGPTHKLLWTVRSFQMFTGLLFQTNYIYLEYCLTLCILKLPQSFEMNRVRQYLVNFMGLMGIANVTVYKTRPIFTGLGHVKLSKPLTLLYSLMA